MQSMSAELGFSYIRFSCISHQQLLDNDIMRIDIILQKLDSLQNEALNVYKNDLKI